jgi:hypothetical protein
MRYALSLSFGGLTFGGSSFGVDPLCCFAVAPVLLETAFTCLHNRSIAP